MSFPEAVSPLLAHLSPWPISCSLEAALASPTITPETVTALLNLAEFMEHDDKRLPLDTRTLGALAEKCHAFAKVGRARDFRTWDCADGEVVMVYRRRGRCPC